MNGNHWGWMSVREALTELGPGAICWYEWDGEMDLIEIGGGENYWVIACRHPIDFIPADFESARICRVMMPETQTR